MPIQMTPEEQSIQRRRAIAEAMMQRGLQPLESIGMAGGAPIPISHAQGLEKLASGYMGQQDVKAADAQLSALEQQKKAEKEAAIQKVLASMQNQPAIPAPADELGGGPGRPEMRKTPQELVQAALVASASPHPEVQNIGSTMWKFREAEQAREVTNAAKGTQLDKLIAKRDELARANPNDPNIEIYNNAIRKESETAKQISPTVNVMGRESTQPLSYVDPITGKPVWGTIKEARGREAAIYSGELQGRLSGSKEAGKGSGEMNLKQYEAATSAANSIQDIDRLIGHIEKSDAITGLGAELFKNVERAKALVGSDIAAGKVKDTELLDVMMGSEVFPMIKTLGVGARGMDTPAEREFMRSVLTGAIPMNKDTLLEMAKTRKRIAQRAIDKWNERTDKGELDNFYNATGISKQKIALSPSTTQVMKPSPEDEAAIAWAQSNPNDPRAAKIMSLHGK